MRFRRIIGATSAVAIMGLGAAVSTAGPASAATINVTPNCGATLTAAPGDLVNVTTTNLQNCFGDGIRLTGSGYIVQIRGTIDGADPMNEDPADNAGIRMDGTTNVRVRYGTVQQFDAGVAIIGGSRNIVQAMKLIDNVNEGVGLNTCEMGDGVVVLNSASNQLLSNTVTGNGPFSGISFVENSDNNLARRNIISDNRASGGCVANLNAGVRIEGPGAQFNLVDDNTIERNLFSGVGLFEFLSQSGRPELQGGCDPDTATPRTPPVSDNRITNNRIRQNGTTVDSLAGGISMFNIGLGDACAATRSTITGNTIAANIGNGLFVAGTSKNNTINNNSVTSNTNNGIILQGPSFRNTFTNVGPTLFDVTNPDLPPYTEGSANQYRVLSGSGSGDLTAQVVAIDPAINDVGGVNTNPVDTSTSGCEATDFTGNPDFSAGDIALIQRGTCSFAQKVDNAIAAGAGAVVLYNEGQAGRQTANFGSAGGVRTIPVLSATYQVGLQLVNLDASGTVTAHIVTNTTNVSSPAASGAENNTLNSNRGTANGHWDGADLNPNCDNNVWTGNIFGTINQACVKAGGGTGTIVP